MCHYDLNTNFVSGSKLSKDPKDWTVTLGEHHLKNEDWFEQSRNVKAIYIHPQYEEERNEVQDNELKGIPPDYDVGERNIFVTLSSKSLFSTSVHRNHLPS